MMEVDLVYLWVDGSDPAWLAKKVASTGGFSAGGETNGKARYENNDELKYSLRSAEKYAPWIRKIFIVTDSQIPAWLDTSNPRVQVIDHTQILPAEALPCYNSRVIESHLYKIPGLAEHFLYGNDDMFFGAPVGPGFFFAEDGYPIVRLKRMPLGKWHYRMKYLSGKKPGSYRTNVHKAALMVEELYGKYYGSLPHHNIDAYKKADFAHAVGSVFRGQAEKALTHRVRTGDDLQRSVILYYALAIGHAHPRYVGNEESRRIKAQSPDYMKLIAKHRPALFCVNDSQRVTDDDRRRIKPFLEELFPERSTFER